MSKASQRRGSMWPGLLALIAPLVLASSGYCQTPPSIKYVNSLDESISVWFQPEKLASFLRPPIYMGPKSEQRVPIEPEYPGKRYIVIRDEANRDTRVGWVDLEAVARSKTPVMLIDGVTVRETRPEVYTVYETYTEVVVGP